MVQALTDEDHHSASESERSLQLHWEKTVQHAERLIQAWGGAQSFRLSHPIWLEPRKICL